MYLNEIEISGTPEFYAKGSQNQGEFYYIGNELLYFPYKDDSESLNLPTKEDGSFLPITTKCSLHSEEFIETIFCEDCETSFEKQLGLTYFWVKSYHIQEPETYLGAEEAPHSAHGILMGDVHSLKINEGKKKTFYVARIAIKDPTASIGFSYASVSSLHPFTVDKGDHLCAKGRITTTQRCLNAICPHCNYINTVVVDSPSFQASAVQSLNTGKGFFQDDLFSEAEKDSSRKHK